MRGLGHICFSFAHFLLCLLFIPSAVNSAFALNIIEAVPGKIYRGATPYTENDFKTLKVHNIKTILNLRVTGTHLEQVRAKKYGIENFFSIPLVPWPGFFPLEPSEKDIEKSLKILANPAFQPVYVHCIYGRERTGLVIALYKIFYENLSPEKAKADMINNHFHKWLTPGLYNYFRNHEFDGERTNRPPEKVGKFSARLNSNWGDL